MKPLVTSIIDSTSSVHAGSGQAMLANGLAILQMLALLWMVGWILAVVSSLVAVVAAVLRRSDETVWNWAVFGAVIDLVPVGAELLVMYDGRAPESPPLALFRILVLLVSILPLLLALAAVVLSAKRPPK